jgi:hypothetical protein
VTDDAPDPYDALARALMRAGDDYVVFPEDDPGFVYVRRKGATETVRCRLDAEARRFLAGEFPTLPARGLMLWLLPP